MQCSDTGRLHQFGKKVPLGMLLGCAPGDRGGVNLERRNFGHMHRGLDASEIHPRRLNAKEVLTSNRDEHFLFSVADGSNKFCGRDHEFRELTPTGNNLRELKIREENFEANQKGFNRQKQQMTLKPGPSSGQAFCSV